MRQIFLDTETTGLESERGHRIIEIAALAYYNRRGTPEEFHYFCNPQREIDRGAQAVHGITAEFLADKPPFLEIAEELRDFLHEGEIMIHNAAFDRAFLDAEFARCEMPRLADINPNITCTLEMSRQKNTGLPRHRLEDLCKYWGVDDSERKTHNAMLDVRLLAQVYFAMSREQISMAMPDSIPAAEIHQAKPVLRRAAAAAERAAHEAYLDGMEKETGAAAVWRR